MKPPGGSCDVGAIGPRTGKSGDYILDQTQNEPDDAVKNEYPWMVMLQKVCRDDKTPSLCSGTLISPTFILSSLGCAHCQVQGEESHFYEAYALLGAYEWKGMYQNLLVDSHFDARKIKEVLTFPEPKNDLAILVMERPAKLSAKICPVLLPDSSRQYVDVKSETVGWTYKLDKDNSSGPFVHGDEITAKLKKCNLRTKYITKDTSESHKSTKHNWITSSYLFSTTINMLDPDYRVTCSACERDAGLFKR